MELGLQKHVAVVTGGASGIGRAVTEAFAAEGCAVAVWDLSEQTEKVAEEIADQHGIACVGLTVDVSSEQAVTNAVAETESRLDGSIDHLVHAAAVGSGKFGLPFTNLAPSDWRKVLDVNVMGMTHVAHALAPGMMERKSGTMLFIASVAGQIGSPTDPPYSASKAANINFAQCMAKDLGPYEVRVNTVCPGMVRTPLNQAVWQAWNDLQPPEGKKGYEEWGQEKARAVAALGQWQVPTDIADMAVFLSSARARNVTGQTINVDGGQVMHS
jgi:2-hydroxycyclohexanecarboxyl-CoA dehydrogenase